MVARLEVCLQWEGKLRIFGPFELLNAPCHVLVAHYVITLVLVAKQRTCMNKKRR